MTRGALLAPAVNKEIRALLPTWIASMAAVGLASMGSTYGIHGAGVLAYALGSVALGALSIGHEYAHGTLALLLCQPASRGRLLAVKLGVLTVMLLTLGAVAWTILLNPRGHLPGFVLFLPVGALLIAPWMSMLCRGSLASIVFTISVTGSMWMVAELLTIAVFGFDSGDIPEAARFMVIVLRCEVAGLCAVAAISTWRMFMRLEVIEGRDAEIQLPRWLRGRTDAMAAGPETARDRHPLWLLVKKELRLQQMSFVVGGLGILEWVTVTAIRQVVPSFAGPPFGAVTFLVSGMLALLIGSLASAEERQLGTLEWQVLLPVAAWRQWIVKTGIVVGLVMLLAIALPALLMYIGPSEDDIRLNQWFAGAAVVLAVGSLYVSSLCSSGVRALVISMPATLGVFVLGGWLGGHGAFLGFHASPMPFVVLSSVVLALMLWFGLENHRSAERSTRRAAVQALCMSGCVALGAAVIYFL
jgi:hypothetical protein